MTDITVFSQAVQAEDLSWDLTPEPDATYQPGGTLDVSLFNQAQHFPNGYIPSGCVLALKTATNTLGPYLSSGTGGLQTPVGLLRATVQVVQPNAFGQLKTKIGVGLVKAFAVVSQSKLPFNSTNQALGGYLDSATKTALPLIFWEA